MSTVRSPMVRSTFTSGYVARNSATTGAMNVHDVGRGVDAQRAARRRLQGAGDVVGLLDVGEDLDAAVVVGPADLGEADLSRGAVEQPRAEPVFQRLDMVAHHGRRHVEPAAGGGEAAAYPPPERRPSDWSAGPSAAPDYPVSLDNPSSFSRIITSQRDIASSGAPRAPSAEDALRTSGGCHVDAILCL